MFGKVIEHRMDLLRAFDIIHCRISTIEEFLVKNEETKKIFENLFDKHWRNTGRSDEENPCIVDREINRS